MLLSTYRAEDGDSIFLRNVGSYLKDRIERRCFPKTLLSTYRAEDGDSMFLRNVCIYLQT
jgi:chemotaxis methyl-accepting protein methylase